MNLNIKTSKLFVWTLLISLMFSCVGTVEEGGEKTTEFSDPKKAAFDFKGIVDYRAVSHSRVELERNESLFRKKIRC